MRYHIEFLLYLMVPNCTYLEVYPSSWSSNKDLVPWSTSLCCHPKPSWNSAAQIHTHSTRMSTPRPLHPLERVQ